MNANRYCRDCGNQVDPNAAVCTSCGAAQSVGVQPPPPPPAAAVVAPPAASFCASCGEALGASAAVCLKCGAAVPGRAIAAGGAGSKSAGVAALLSFIFVGAGQIYVGDDMGRAIGLMIGGFLLFIVGWLTLILLIPAIILWIWNIFDAQKRAQAWNVQHGFAANT